MRHVLHIAFIGMLFLFQFLLNGQNSLAATSAPGADTAREEKGSLLTRLPNGLLVYIIKDDRFPLVCTRLYVRAGSANESASQAGISHVLEHMVFKGTEHHPKGEIARKVESLGGYLNAATSFDKTWYLTDMPSEYWQTGLEVIKEMAFQATLDSAELEAEKNVVISELQRGEDSPQRKLYEDLQVSALKNTPYGRPIIGYVDTIKSITVDDLRAYTKKWYQPQNMMLLVAGNVDQDEVLAYSQKLFGELKNSSDLPLPAPLDIRSAPGGEQISISRGPWNKIYFGMALPVPGFRDLQSVDLDVLSFMLGGDGTSEFYKKFKYDLQLVDNISVDNMSLARAGLLTITAQLDEANLEKFWTELTKSLAELNAREFDSNALERAKFNLEDSMDRAGETLNGLASWKGTVEFDLGGEQGEENLRFTQNNVDRIQLENTIDKWLVPSESRIRLLVPEKAKVPDLAGIMQKNWPQKEPEKKSPDQAERNNAPEVVDMGNGCKLILIPDSTTPYMSLDILMPGGNSLLHPEQQGLAELTARMLTDGCGELDAPGIERWLSQRAAELGAKAGIQTFGISLSGPSRFSDDFFNIIHRTLFNPRFDPAELKREVNSMKAALKQRQDNPLSFMFSKLYPFLFPGQQPYGFDNLGCDNTLDKFNVVNVRDFWTLQSGQPWTIAIAGDFSREEVLKFAKGLPAPHTKEFKATKPVWGQNKNLALTLPGKNQAHLLQIFKTVPLTEPDAPGLMLLQTILSGQSGLLFKNLRDEQGLGYTVTAFNRTMPETGFMAFYIGSTPEKISRAKDGFREIIHQLKTTLLDKRLLESGINKLWGDYLRDRQSLGARAVEAATNGVLGYPQNFQELLIDKAKELTPEDLQKIAQKFLNPEDSYEVILNP